jgi:hypothetical protein
MSARSAHQPFPAGPKRLVFVSAAGANKPVSPSHSFKIGKAIVLGGEPIQKKTGSTFADNLHLQSA